MFEKNMRSLMLVFTLVLPMMSQAQQLEGAFLLKASQYGEEVSSEEESQSTKVVKIFKDGYWITGFFGHQKHPFDGSGGGTYTTDKGKYIETLRFYSWDSTAAGKTYTFDYRLEGGRYFQEGFINSDKYKNYLIKEEMSRIRPVCDLKNAALEGVWFLKESLYDDEKSEIVRPVEMVKIYAYPRFAWARYNTATGQFLGAGGGSYSFDGKKLIEHIEYITYDMAIGSDIEAEVQLEGRQMQQSFPVWRGKELWQRAGK